jgi:L-seryl-tRNA(Ser) seleniumtransferase
VRRALEAGVDLVCISGDKLLGGPQAGVLLGKRELVDKARKHPLMRALRPDKMCLAALVATLQLWRDRPERVPVARMMRTSVTELQRRAERAVELLGDGAHVVQTRARIGGGSSPLVELDSRAVALAAADADDLAARLREADPPVIARIEDDRVLLDLMAIAPEDDEALLASARAALGARDG